MKFFHIIWCTILILFFTSLNAHAQEFVRLDSIHSMEDYQNGIYYGCSQANDILTRFQEAFARAVGDYVEHNQELISSATDSNGKAVTTTAAKSTGTFGATVVEYKDYAQTPVRSEIRVKIDPLGKGYRHQYSSYLEVTEDRNGNSSIMSYTTVVVTDEVDQIKMYYKYTAEEGTSDNDKTITRHREVRNIDFTSNFKTY